MWVIFFGFIVLGWVILKNEKNFNRSIQTLEEHIYQQQNKIDMLEIEIEYLKKK